MDLVYIGDRQAGWFTNWYVFHDPFTFVIFWVYFTCATASVNRAPFDLAEAESELVAGFHTEYSGLRWSFFFMAEYGSMLAVSLLASILFFGGWNGPIPITRWLGAVPQLGWRHEYAGNVLGCINILAKGVLGVTAMMWVRWTLPRLRIDQVITVCLKYCVPIAAVAFLGATWWQYQWPDRAFFGVRPLPQSAYLLRENWPTPPTEPAASTQTDRVDHSADSTTTSAREAS
jgi:NADH-quinone oxidoreductase subunit H